MMIKQRGTVSVPSENININEREVFLRLGRSPLDETPCISECTELVKHACSYKYCYVMTEIKRSGDTLDLGFGEFESKTLAKNLDGCSSAFVFVATTSVAVDRLLSRLSVTSPTKQFVADAVASAAIESLCDYVQGELCKDLAHKPRFSPGFGDLPLDIQPKILSMLDAEKQIGVTLTDAFLMIPSKSVTAIIGVMDNDNN